MLRRARAKARLAHRMSNAALDSNVPAGRRRPAPRRSNRRMSSQGCCRAGAVLDRRQGRQLCLGKLNGNKMQGVLPPRAESPMRSAVAEIPPAHGTEEGHGGERERPLPAESRLRDSELFLLVLAFAAG